MIPLKDLGSKLSIPKYGTAVREEVSFMKALVLEKPYSFAVLDLPEPVPGAGEALVRVLSAGICGSEVHAYHGKHPKRLPPAVMGHEVCGVVEQLGEGVTENLLGRRVIVMPQKACGVCRWCSEGKPNLCDSKVMLGEKTWPGGYAEYFVAPASLLYPVPEHLSNDAATLIEPLAVAVHAVRCGGVGLGDRIAVLGAGAIGLMTVVAAHAAGASMILASDICAYNLDRALEAGATHVCNARRQDVVNMALELSSGMGMDHVFMAVDAPGLFDQAIRGTRKQGHLTMIALFTDPVSVKLQIPKSKELLIRGSVTFDSSDFRIAVELAAQSGVNLEKFITHRFPLDKGNEAFALVQGRTEDLVRVVFHP